MKIRQWVEAHLKFPKKKPKKPEPPPKPDLSKLTVANNRRSIRTSFLASTPISSSPKERTLIRTNPWLPSPRGSSESCSSGLGGSITSLEWTSNTSLCPKSNSIRRRHSDSRLVKSKYPSTLKSTPPKSNSLPRDGPLPPQQETVEWELSVLNESFYSPPFLEAEDQFRFDPEYVKSYLKDHPSIQLDQSECIPNDARSELSALEYSPNSSAHLSKYPSYDRKDNSHLIAEVIDEYKNGAAKVKAPLRGSSKIVITKEFFDALSKESLKIDSATSFTQSRIATLHRENDSKPSSSDPGLRKVSRVKHLISNYESILNSSDRSTCSERSTSSKKSFTGYLIESSSLVDKLKVLRQQRQHLDSLFDSFRQQDADSRMSVLDARLQIIEAKRQMVAHSLKHYVTFPHAVKHR